MLVNTTPISCIYTRRYNVRCHKSSVTKHENNNRTRKMNHREVRYYGEVPHVTQEGHVKNTFTPAT
jgi:hypothetical protein